MKLRRSERQKNTYFDPRQPEIPEEVLGIDTEDLLKLKRATMALGILPIKAELALYDLPDILRITPLLEDIGENGEVSSNEVRAYRKPIKHVAHISGIDKLSTLVPPARKALNRRVENEFQPKAIEIMAQAREAIATIEDDVDFIASFNNPRAQFESEITHIANETTKNILSESNLGGSAREISPPTPRGFAGFVTRFIRGIKSLFSRPKRSMESPLGVNAYSVGMGVHKTLVELTTSVATNKRKLPMLSRLVIDKLDLTNVELPSYDKIAFLAPELVTFLYSTSTSSDIEKQIINAVRHNPHELRFITRYKHNYKSGHRVYNLDRIEYATHTLLPTLRDILPTNGSQVKQLYSQVLSLLSPKVKPIDQTKHVTDTKVKKKHFWNRSERD